MGNHQSASAAREGKYELPRSSSFIYHNHRRSTTTTTSSNSGTADCFGNLSEKSSSRRTTGGLRKTTTAAKSTLRLLPKRNRSHNNSPTSIASFLASPVPPSSKGRRSSVDDLPTPTYYLAGKYYNKKSKTQLAFSLPNPPTPLHFDEPPSFQDPTTSSTAESVAEAQDTNDMPNPNLEKFAKLLSQASKSTSPKGDSIAREIFQKHVVPHSPACEPYLWAYYNDWKDHPGLKPSAFIQHTEKIFGLITDKDQNSFYVKLYSKDKDSIDRNAFLDLLITSYQLSSSSVHDPRRRDLSNSDAEFEGREWMESVTKSCFHIKDAMSVFYVTNWLSTNMPRVFTHVHKYLVHQLTIGYTRLSSETESPAKSDDGASGEQTEEQTWSGAPTEVQGISPTFMWLLTVSIPPSFMASLEKKESPAQQVHRLMRMQSRDLLAALMSSSQPKWTLLYDSEDHGLSINRFQHHVFNYRGPTLLLLKCDNDYEILVGIDTEWKENCHFWGGKDCFIMQLKPEFRLVEKGEKSLYANFSIRGYAFGIQAGQDPRNVSVNINADFEHVEFKKIPSRIISLTVWGCGSQDTKVAQAEHKKWEAKECEKQKKININAGEWGDNPDKYLLELAGYKSYGS